MDEDQGETTNDRGRDHPTGRVRIIGADRVGEPVVPEGTVPPPEGDDAAEPVFVFQPPDGEPQDESSPELPHWTEAPTGELPAVLARHAHASEDPWNTVPEPTWREDNADWAAGEDRFAPSMLRSDDEPFPNQSGAEDRQPWAFELDDPPGEDAGPWPEPHGEAEPPDGPEDDDLTAVLPVVVEDAAEPADREDGDELPAGRTWRTRRLGGTTGEGRPVGEGPLGSAGIGGTAPLSGIGRAAGFPGARLPAGAVGARRPFGARHPDGWGSSEDEEGRSGRNVPAAVGSGLVVGVIALIAFHFGSVPALLVVVLVIGLAATEAFAAFRRGGYHPATLPGLVAVVGVVVASYDKGPQAVPAVLVLLVAVTFLWHLTGVDRRAEPVRSTAATLLVFAWVGGFGAYAGLLLAPSAFPDRHGIAYLLGALVTAVAYDVGALMIGAWVGRHPLSQVSPNKTWEGLLGGAFFSIVSAVIVVHFIHPWTLGKAVVLGIVVAVVMPIGDLGESLVKRHLGLKDMGRILPGHGGLLDRVDGLLFVLPATYYLVKAFHLG